MVSWFSVLQSDVKHTSTHNMEVPGMVTDGFEKCSVKLTTPTTEPRLPAYFREGLRIEDRFLAVWCKYCGCLHLHGEGDGSRVAHCHIVTPYTETGYCLVSTGKKLPEDALALQQIGYKKVWARVRKERRARIKKIVLEPYEPVPVPDWGRELD